MGGLADVRNQRARVVGALARADSEHTNSAANNFRDSKLISHRRYSHTASQPAIQQTRTRTGNTHIMRELCTRRRRERRVEWKQLLRMNVNQPRECVCVSVCVQANQEIVRTAHDLCVRMFVGRIYAVCVCVCIPVRIPFPCGKMHATKQTHERHTSRPQFLPPSPAGLHRRRDDDNGDNDTLHYVVLCRSNFSQHCMTTT